MYDEATFFETEAMIGTHYVAHVGVNSWLEKGSTGIVLSPH